MTASLFAIAWRNVARNRRRSAITAAAIAIGLAALLFLWGLNDGFHNNMMRNYRELMVGSLQVHKAGFFRHPKLETHIAEPGAVAQALARAGVGQWTPRLTGFVLAAGEETSAGMALVGMDPEREPRVTRISEKVVEGRFLAAGDDRVCVLGAAGARKLRVGIGDPVILLGQDRMGGLAAERFTLVGIVRAGEPVLDRGTVLAPLAAVQEMLAMEGRITDVVARVPESRLDAVTATLGTALAGRGLEVLRWFDMFPLIKEWVALDNGFQYIFVGIVALIVVAGVVNTVLMSMIERTREFGMLMALGTKSTAIGAIVVFESLIIGVIGTAAGTAAGLGLVGFFGRTGIDLGAMSEALTRFYVDPVVRTEIDTDHLLITVAGLLAAVVLSGLYPAWQAMRLEPVEAIRHV